MIGFETGRALHARLITSNRNHCRCYIAVMPHLETWYAKNAGLIGILGVLISLVALIITVGAVFFQDEWKRRFKDIPRQRRVAGKIRNLRYRRLLIEAFKIGLPSAHVLLVERFLLFFRNLVGVFLGFRIGLTIAFYLLAKGHVTFAQIIDYIPDSSRLAFEACLAYAIVQCGHALGVVNDIMLHTTSIPRIEAELAALDYVEPADQA